MNGRHSKTVRKRVPFTARMGKAEALGESECALCPRRCFICRHVGV